MIKTMTAFAVVCFCAVAAADPRPDAHAPINVMGDHLHKSGEVMFSYRFMTMSMDGNRDGSSRRTPNEIVTTEPNRFANPPMMPPTLRVVPEDMTMNMHMLGMMYAPSDRLTLMAMTNFISLEMDHTTYMGPMGTTVLGSFRTETQGIGDTSLSGLIHLADHWHATLGLSIPTGSLDETDTILTPMNTTPEVRLPYPMQLSSGTYDLITGLTYADHRGDWGWGAQWTAVWRTGENDEDYTLGDQLGLQGWLSYRAGQNVSISTRLNYLDRDNIDGMDPMIRAPVQTADPDRQGFRRLEIGVGFNVLLPDPRHRLALELTKPLSQDLDGPQLETDWHVTLGWQFAPGMGS